MMDRHDEMSASFIGHVHGLFRSAVRMNPGIVSADRHDRQIDGTESAQLRKRIAQRSVARKKEATVISLDNVAVVTAIDVALLPRAPMFDAERGDVDLATKSAKNEIWLPFLDTYRTMCLAPNPEFRHVLEEIWEIPLAA